jgi:hypothetical protein
MEKLLRESHKLDIEKLRPYLAVIYRANIEALEELRKMNDKTFDEWFARTGLKAHAEALAEARGEARANQAWQVKYEEAQRQMQQLQTARASTT